MQLLSVSCVNLNLSLSLNLAGSDSHFGLQEFIRPFVFDILLNHVTEVQFTDIELITPKTIRWAAYETAGLKLFGQDNCYSAA